MITCLNTSSVLLFNTLASASLKRCFLAALRAVMIVEFNVTLASQTWLPLPQI